MQSPRSLAALALAGTLVVAGCASDKASDGGSGSAGPGVSEDTIKLGVLTDQSGPFVELGTGVVNGHEIWAEEINANGGVCDRQVELVTRDSGYDADTGVVQYQEVEPNVLGFMQILGSPINAALDAQYEQNETVVVALSWSSFILENPYIVIPGTTYDVEMINGLNFLLEQGDIKEGDTVGYIYLEGEYGENGLLGAEYFAEQHDITLETVKVLPTDTDLRNVVTGLNGKGVKAIGLTTTPAQTLSAAVVSAQLGLNVPLVGNNPTFSPQILNQQTAGPLQQLLPRGQRGAVLLRRRGGAERRERVRGDGRRRAAERRHPLRLRHRRPVGPAAREDLRRPDPRGREDRAGRVDRDRHRPAGGRARLLGARCPRDPRGLHRRAEHRHAGRHRAAGRPVRLRGRGELHRARRGVSAPA